MCSITDVLPHSVGLSITSLFAIINSTYTSEELVLAKVIVPDLDDGPHVADHLQDHLGTDSIRQRVGSSRQKVITSVVSSRQDHLGRESFSQIIFRIIKERIQLVRSSRQKASKMI